MNKIWDASIRLFTTGVVALLLIAGGSPAVAQRSFLGLSYDEALRRAEAGEAAVQIELGIRFEKGETIPADDLMAVYWFKQAADQGDAAGQALLGRAYAEGLGVSPDPREAVRLYRLAAEQGHVGSQALLGYAHSLGQGVDADPVEGYAWVSIANAQRGKDVSGLETVKSLLTAQEIREGQALAREYWKKFVLPARARAETEAEVKTERKRIEVASRKEAERALQEAIARDALQLDKERLALLDAGRMEYIAQIKDKIERNWLRPPGTALGLECIVRVSQIPGGEVVQAEIQTSSGDVAFDRSVEEAVLRSSPLPVPEDPSLFDRHIVIIFEPEI